MIRRTDKVSSVLSLDPTLVEVFAAVAPAFERLRNPALRRVMSQLVSVEQAARIAGVDADVLVARLNGNAGRAPAEPGRRPPMGDLPIHQQTAVRPAALDEVPAEAVVTLDVRDELRAGREPFSLIMDAVRQVPPGGALSLRAIFEPVPLYEVLGRRGFAHWAERHAPDDWTVWFYPAATDAAPVATDAGVGEAGEEAGSDVVVLDVRGLEPPEPMLRTLQALEALPAGAVLVQLNARPPQFLLPILEERGFTYEIRQQSPDLVRIFIRRTGES